jgi:hypothetical protein
LRAKQLVLEEPAEVQWWGSWAYATAELIALMLHELILLSALDQHPASAVLNYNLACYECQLGSGGGEKTEDGFGPRSLSRLQALDDPDLEAVWE